MLDAHSAPAAPARPPAAAPAPAIADAAAPQAAVPSKPAALLAAARTLLPVLEAGRPLDARSLRSAMTGAFGASDADGAWVWKDAYEAAEAALVLFIQRYGRAAMRREVGPGPDGPAAMLRMLETLAALEPSQTRIWLPRHERAAQSRPDDPGLIRDRRHSRRDSDGSRYGRHPPGFGHHRASWHD